VVEIAVAGLYLRMEAIGPGVRALSNHDDAYLSITHTTHNALNLPMLHTDIGDTETRASDSIAYNSAGLACPLHLRLLLIITCCPRTPHQSQDSYHTNTM
jgi:hypothetical protein